MAQFNIQSNISEVTGRFSAFSSLLSGGVKNAIGVVNTSLLTLAANPIGAVLAAVGVVIVAITASLSRLQPVVDEINVRVAQLSAAWSFLVDTVGSYLGIADGPSMSFRDTVVAAGELERATQSLADEQNELIVSTARRNATIAEQRLIAADATRTDEERIEALREAQRVTNELFDDEERVARERLRILTEQQALGDNTREDNEEAARLEAQLIELGTRRSRTLMQTEAAATALERRTQMAADAATRSAEAQAERDQKEEDRAEEMAQKEMDRIRELRQQREIDLLIAGGSTEEEVFEARLARAETEEEVAQIMHEQEVFRLEEIRDAKADEAEEERKQIEETMLAEEKAAMEKMRLDEMAGDLARDQDQATFDTLIGLLGEGSTAGRAIAVTQATIKGIEGVQNAYTTAQSSPITALFPGYPLVQAGIAGAFSATQIASILQTPAPTGFTTTGPGTAAPAFGATLSTPNVLPTQLNGPQPVMVTNQQEQSSVIAVTTDGDIRNSNERNQRITNRRRI